MPPIAIKDSEHRSIKSRDHTQQAAQKCASTGLLFDKEFAAMQAGLEAMLVIIAANHEVQGETRKGLWQASLYGHFERMIGSFPWWPP